MRSCRLSIINSTFLGPTLKLGTAQPLHLLFPAACEDQQGPGHRWDAERTALRAYDLGTPSSPLPVLKGNILRAWYIHIMRSNQLLMSGGGVQDMMALKPVWVFACRFYAADFKLCPKAQGSKYPHMKHLIQTIP